MKRIFLLTWVAAVLAATPLWVSAQSGKRSATSEDATEAEDDKKLNAAYQNLIHTIYASIPKGRAELTVESLRESQRAWLKYREAQLTYVGTYNEVGSASARRAGLAQYNHELTTARIQDLQAVPDPF